MKFITYGQYIEYLKNSNPIGLKEKYTDYQFLNLLNNEIYDKKRIKEIDKRHDKMFRNILSRKKEIVSFLNEFLGLKEKIKEKQILQCHTDFITKQYENKQSDLIYQLKDKPVYFLIEHQSTINQEMPLRIWQYVGEIMRRESILQKTYLQKNKIYPVVVPIVIYTGFQSLQYKEYQINLGYNLITVQDYTFEELLEKQTLFASIMVIEKCRKIEELVLQMNKIIEIITEPKDIEALADIIMNVIAYRIGHEETTKMLEKIKRKEETYRN